MSYSTVLGVVSESDSRILVDACLARVRKDAGIDQSVLPQLHALIARPDLRAVLNKERMVMSRSAIDLPSPEAIVKSAATTNANANANAIAILKTTAVVDVVQRRDERSERARAVTCLTEKAKVKTLGQRMRWPVFLCGFLAGTFGGVAVMKSPIGQKPTVQRVVKSVRDHGSSAYSAVAATKSRGH